MRRYVFIIALALSVFLLHACAKTVLLQKDDSVVLTSGTSDIPTADSAAQEEDSPDEQSSQPEAGLNSAKPSASEAVDTAQASPQIAPDEADNNAPEDTGTDPVKNEPAPSPKVNITPDITTEPEPAAEIPQNQTAEQPPLLTKTLEGAGLSFDDLTFSQLVLIAADGSDAMVYCYDKGENGLWNINGDIGYIKGYVGKNGVSAAKSEGDNCTPAGLFNLGYAFGNRSKPSTGMVYKEITEESYWVDDPNSKYYNQWVEGTADADWSSAEHLSENKNTYAYAIVVEYNMAPDTVAGKGSAIFLHIKNEPTTGCIAVSETAILKILKWLSSDKNPGMLIAAR